MLTAHQESRHKTAAGETTRTRNGDGRRIAARRSWRTEFVKEPANADARCRTQRAGSRYTAWDFVTDVENDAIDQLTRDGDLSELPRCDAHESEGRMGLLLGLVRKKEQEDRCAYKWRRCQRLPVLLGYQSRSTVSEMLVVVEGRCGEGLLLKRRATKCCCCRESVAPRPRGHKGRRPLLRAACAGCDVGTTKRLPLHCVSAKYFAEGHFEAGTVKKGGAGGPAASPSTSPCHTQSGLRGLAGASYKPDAGEIRPRHDAVRDAKQVRACAGDKTNYNLKHASNSSSRRGTPRQTAQPGRRDAMATPAAQAPFAGAGRAPSGARAERHRRATCQDLGEVQDLRQTGASKSRVLARRSGRTKVRAPSRNGWRRPGRTHAGA